MLEKGDLFWQDSLTHCLCQVWWRHTHLWPMDPAQEDLLQIYQERVERLSQQNRVIQFVLMQDSWQHLTSDSISWRKTLKNIHNSQNQWLVVSTLCQEMKKSSDPKGWIRGNTKIGPVLEVTTCCLQGKYGVKIRIESVNKDNSHSWVRISHGLNRLVTGLEQKRAGNLRKKVRRFCVEIECTCFMRADQRLKQNHNDVFLPVHPQKLFPLGKELGPILNHKIKRPSIIQCRSRWALFFVMVIYLEKMMERLNSGE